MVKSRRDEATEDRKRQRKERIAQAGYGIGYGKTDPNTRFKPGNQAARKSSKPPASHDWSAPDVVDPKKRPRSFSVTDPADVGADMLEEPVPYTINGKRTKVPFIYAALDQLRKDMLTGSRRDRTESMRMYLKVGAFERLVQRQYLRARQFEMKNREWWERRMQGLKNIVLHAAAEERLTAEKTWEDIIDLPLFDGEQDRLMAELLKYAAACEDSSDFAPADEDTPPIDESFDLEAQGGPEIQSLETKSSGSELDSAADECGDIACQLDEDVWSPLRPDLEIGSDEDFEREVGLRIGDVPIAHSPSPAEAADGPKGALWADYVPGGSKPAQGGSTSEPPDNVEPEQEAESEPGEVGPPVGHPSEMTDIAEEGQVIFWAKQGKGYQQIRAKSGWINGPRTKH